MDIPTIPGSWYTVATATTCEITDTATGTPLGTADAGSYSFQAQGNLTTLSDDSALYSKSNFKSAPAALMALGLLGGGASASALPAGYLAAEFLESTGEQYIKTSVIPTASTGIEAEYEISKNVTGRKNVIGSQTRGGQSMFILMGAGYGWNTARVGVGETNYARLNWKGNKMYENGSTVKELPSLNFTPILPLFMFCLNFGGGKDELTPQKIKWVKIDNGEKLISHFFPVLDNQGVPCMYDKVNKETFTNSGTGQFIVGMTLSQARKLFNLPATGGSLTISLPTGYESDAGVTTALDTARANGWTLTIQTYTPEAAAPFALRRIWVRRTQSENGAHVAADGSRWQVEWCVDMLTPDGSTPDAHGYELFRSQEAAVAYWELTPYVDPESENLLTE